MGSEIKNPLKLIEPMKQYKADESPLKRLVIDRLIKQGYLNKMPAYDALNLNAKPTLYVSLTYRGNQHKDAKVLPGWENWTEEVRRVPDLDGLEQTRLLYGK